MVFSNHASELHVKYVMEIFYILRPEQPEVGICMDNDKILIHLRDIPN
jgi:hypothetical protein